MPFVPTLEKLSRKVTSVRKRSAKIAKRVLLLEDMYPL